MRELKLNYLQRKMRIYPLIKNGHFQMSVGNNYGGKSGNKIKSCLTATYKTVIDPFAGCKQSDNFGGWGLAGGKTLQMR